MEKFLIYILEKLAGFYLRRNQPKIVAVTGSVGKSSTKKAIAEVLSKRYKVMAHEGYNSTVGVPLALFEIKAPASTRSPLSWLHVLSHMTLKLLRPLPYDVIVIELGAARPGGIAQLLRYIKPHIGIVTAVHHTHIERFESIDAVLAEKSLVALHSERAIINIDDELLYRELLPQLQESTTETYGITNERATTRLRKVQRDDSGYLSFSLNEVRIASKMLGEHNLYALLAASVVGRMLDVDDQDVVTALSSTEPVRGRMQLLQGIKDSRIIDDSYNSSPKAAIEAIVTLSEIEASRKIAVLGSMNELGDFAEEGHMMVTRALLAHPVAVLITIGDDARKFIADNHELQDSEIYSFDSPYQAGAELKRIVETSDLVLVKGSQGGIFSEEAIKPILQNEKDVNKLVRQSEFWQAKKRAAFEDAV